MPADRSISIAMATYNGARFIRQQLDSLAAQTLLPAELIVTDDQSSDATVEIVRDFAAAAPFPVRLHVNDKRWGWRGNFVNASNFCTGDLIAFCDQDDIWYPDKLAVMVRQFDDPEVLFAFHNADLMDAEGRNYDTLMPVVETVERIAPLSRPTPWANALGLTTIFRRSLTAFNIYWERSVDRGDPQANAAHDQWYYYLASNLGTLVGVPDRLLGYRQHGSNVVGFAPSNVHLPLTAPRPAVRAKIEPVVIMLRAYTRILRQAEADGLTAAFPLLPAACRQNEAYLARLERRLEIYGDVPLPRRAALLAGLLTRGGYVAGSGWMLGRRALLSDLLVGVPKHAAGAA